ncbi:MAG: ABC transporter permease [Acidobacteriia bacterium]|nr:ABC transporter permease [Terriglobia bacterium]
MRHFLRDIRYELRVLARAPGFSLAIVLTLAFGIGVNIALYSFVYTVLLKPLPFKDSSRIAMIWTSMPELGFPKLLTSPADYTDWAAAQKSFESVALFEDLLFDITGSGQPERLTGAKVSSSLFPMLGVQPLAGRTFIPAEDSPGQHVAILSYGLWKRRYAGQSIIGKPIFLDRQPYTVVGIMPREFVFPLSGPEGNSDPAQFWVPVGLEPLQLFNRGAMYEFSVLGRLTPGASFAQAESEAKLIGAQVRSRYPARTLAALHHSSISFAVVPYHKEIQGKIRMPLLVLLGAVVLLLLITCSNISNLLLVRGAARQREMAIRTSLGATWWQAARLMLAEGTILAFLGGISGAALALGSRGFLISLLPTSFPQTASIEMNGPVLGFAFLLCVVASMIFGLVSVIAMFRAPLRQVLQEGGRSPSGTRSHRRLQGALVIAQCGIALALLIGSGLLLRSFSRLLATDPGFQPQHVLEMTIYLPRETYSGAVQIKDFYQQVLEHARAVPGIRIAGLSTDLPLDAQERELIHNASDYKGKADTLPSVIRSWVIGDYLKTLDIPLIAGRQFTPEDNEKSFPIVVISKDLAQRLWPGEEAIGKRLRAGPSPDLTVVGVVGDVKDGSLGEETHPHLYTPYRQEQDDLISHPTWGGLRTMNLVIQTSVEPASVAKLVQQEIWRLDPQLAITHVQPLKEKISDSIAPQKFNLFLLSTIAFLAVFLAIVGVYGVTSYAISQRTQEIGVRIALGASPSSILLMILRHGLLLIFAGIVIGVVGSLALSRFLQSLLYGITTTDTMTFIAAPVLLILIALAACYFPARRAMRLQPNVALRHE